jgi:hypothetical protein
VLLWPWHNSSCCWFLQAVHRRSSNARSSWDQQIGNRPSTRAVEAQDSAAATDHQAAEEEEAEEGESGGGDNNESQIIIIIISIIIISIIISTLQQLQLPQASQLQLQFCARVASCACDRRADDHGDGIGAGDDEQQQQLPISVWIIISQSGNQGS